MDGQSHDIQKWDLVIAHPPCTYLTVTGNRWFDVEKYGDAAKKRHSERLKAIVFFMRCVYANSDRVCVENPIGVMGTAYEKATQIIQPYQFGHPTRKSTCLWLKNLEPLKPTNVVDPIIVRYKNGKGTDSLWHMESIGMTPEERQRYRSRTFEGIGQAMADQWG